MARVSNRVSLKEADTATTAIWDYPACESEAKSIGAQFDLWSRAPELAPKSNCG